MFLGSSSHEEEKSDSQGSRCQPAKKPSGGIGKYERQRLIEHFIRNKPSVWQTGLERSVLHQALVLHLGCTQSELLYLSTNLRRRRKGDLCDGNLLDGSICGMAIGVPVNLEPSGQVRKVASEDFEIRGVIVNLVVDFPQNDAV